MDLPDLPAPAACYHAALNFKTSQLTLAALLAAWLALAAPPLRTQIDKTLNTRALFEGRDTAERTSLLDNPGFRVAQEIGSAVPLNECVVVLAYAGPAAIDYYQSRFAYYLYPGKVLVFDEVSATAADCRYLAVFRDTAQNLANEPFAGSWNQADLSQRLSSLGHVQTGELTQIYRVP